jgi:hypothetical protein
VLEIDAAAKLLGEPGHGAAPGSRADGFVPGLEVVDPRRHEDRERARDHEVVEFTEGMLDQPVPFLFVDHLALFVAENAGGARVDDEESRVAEVPVEGPAGGGRFAVPAARPLAEAGAAVSIGLHLGQQLFLGEFGRREVADVLVDPVGHERAGDPGVPPGPAAHLGYPFPRDVPVVVDVVVVEDHHARDG